MDSHQYNQIQARIDFFLERRSQLLSDQMAFDRLVWVAVPSDLIPEQGQSRINGLSQQLAELESEITELRAEIHPYCYGVLNRFGEQAHQWLQARYKTLNSETIIVTVPFRSLNWEGVYYWLPPPTEQQAAKYTDEPLPIAETRDPYRIAFDIWAYADENGRPVNGFQTAYLPDIDHLFVLT